MKRLAGRLVVRSGVPLFVEAFIVAGPFLLLLLATVLKSRREEPGLAHLLVCVGLSAVVWKSSGSWTLTLDRREGMARLRRGPWRTRRLLTSFGGVRLCSMRQAQIDQVLRHRGVMPFAPVADIGYSVALVDASGRWWRVTRSLDRNGCRPRREDAVHAARLVAEYLGIPFLAPYETPPGGAVPLALDDAAVLRRPG